MRWVYRADDLSAVIDFSRQPKLDGSRRTIAVEGVDLMGKLTWSYGCTETQEGGTETCPANLGYYQPLGPLVF